MQFQSFDYLFAFLPFTLFGYLVLRRSKFANAFMLLMSLYFYALSAWWYLLPFFFTAVLDFYIGQSIADSDDGRYRRNLLIVSCVANLGVLSIFKYTTWLSGNVTDLLAMFGIAIASIVLALPPAISFYTFQSMSYTIDVYRKEFTPHRNIVDYLSFVAFFPHLVAGPMMRARDLLPQLAAVRPLPSVDRVAGALFMILFGLCQKIVFADNFGALADWMLRLINPTTKQLEPGIGVIFVYSFAFQIYCDFSAYTTIARGTARLFGVELMRNFLTPYFASNPSDFWQRWHISLSTWLRDYLYIPLGGNRHGTSATLRNLMITMLLGGLWHGAGIFFIVWGAYHGLLLILYRVIPIDRYLIQYLGRAGEVVSRILFFHLVCLGWIFFRSPPADFLPVVHSIAAAATLYVSNLSSWLPYLADFAMGMHPILFGETFWRMLWVSPQLNFTFWFFFQQFVVLTIPLVVMDYIGFRNRCEFPDLFASMPNAIRVVMILLLFYGIEFYGRREGSAFIYFAF
jgi:D-alanyl-lipoteichoic acid acyltransferase DltB (MBOAT superfamily)